MAKAKLGKKTVRKVKKELPAYEQMRKSLKIDKEALQAARIIQKKWKEAPLSNDEKQKMIIINEYSKHNRSKVGDFDKVRK